LTFILIVSFFRSFELKRKHSQYIHFFLNNDIKKAITKHAFKFIKRWHFSFFNRTKYTILENDISENIIIYIFKQIQQPKAYTKREEHQGPEINGCWCCSSAMLHNSYHHMFHHLWTHFILLMSFVGIFVYFIFGFSFSW